MLVLDGAGLGPQDPPSFGLSPGVEGVSVGLRVGAPDGSGFGVVAALALVTVTVTGAPGPAVNVFDDL
ncbi:hypothetical protein [Streptomyces sp. NPDC059479]|uniref:hypothetical protein n=1 Tax=Streptomyces sp. NPDC059479 TaxID=3346848 RepID=UPI003691C83E